jgi:hypothetical protein
MRSLVVVGLTAMLADCGYSPEEQYRECMPDIAPGMAKTERRLAEEKLEIEEVERKDGPTGVRPYRRARPGSP